MKRLDHTQNQSQHLPTLLNIDHERSVRGNITPPNFLDYSKHTIKHE